MTTQERLMAINNFADNREKERLEREAAKRAEEAKAIQMIKTEIVPRVMELFPLAQACSQRGVVFTTENRGYTKFCSDGFYHKLGFIVKNPCWMSGRDTTVMGFGIIGGGLCGKNLIIHLDGSLEIQDRDEREREYKINKVLDDFGTFEHDFLDAIDSLK